MDKHESNQRFQSVRKYPDTSHLSALEAVKGIEMDQEFLHGQRVALQRIQSERFCDVGLRPPCFERGKDYQTLSARSLASTCFETTQLSSERPIVDILSSQEIRDQRRMFDMLGSGPHHKPIDVVPCEPPHVLEASEAPSTPEETVVLDIQPDTASREPPFPKNLTAAAHTHRPSFDDRVGRFRSGKKVRIVGASRVYDDISRGNAVIVQCPHCNTSLQVGQEATNVFCSVCGRVSAAKSMMQGSISRGIVDHEIASNVQDQEYDVAMARLQAKLYAKDSNVRDFAK